MTIFDWYTSGIRLSGICIEPFFCCDKITTQLRLGVTEHINICFTIPYNKPLV